MWWTYKVEIKQESQTNGKVMRIGFVRGSSCLMQVSVYIIQYGRPGT